MLKGIAASLVAGSAYVLALGSIVSLEQQRSLGNGRLASFLSAHDRAVVQRAELAIGRTKQPLGVPLLSKRAASQDAGTRSVAIYGLGLIGTPAVAIPVLRSLNDTSGTVLASALDATNRLEFSHTFTAGQEGVALARTERLLRNAIPQIRARAALTLETFSGGPQASKAMSALERAYASEEDSAAREQIAWALYRGYAQNASPAVLRQQLKDRDDIVRIEAVRALGKRGDRRFLVSLMPLRADPSWRVQEQALESIKVLNGGKPTEHLAALPAGLHLPPRTADPLDALPALPRSRHVGKFSPPAASRVSAVPQFSVNSLADLTGPMPGPHPRMRIVTTQGNVYVELFPEWAPLTVENFMNLAQGGYYDGNPWFRIVPDFVVQSGDPSANAPGVGYTTVAEENPIEQDSYVIAMGLDYTNPPNAHAKRDSAGSEFYITLSPQYHLDRDFSVFGRMIGGFDVLPRLIEKDKIVRIERIADSAR